MAADAQVDFPVGAGGEGEAESQVMEVGQVVVAAQGLIQPGHIGAMGLV